MAFEEKELEWDDEIEKDGSDHILLPEGDYDFTVINYEKGHFDGNDYTPPCKSATLTVKVLSKEREEVFIKHTLYLHSTKEKKLSEFFVSIGEKELGKKVRMNWNAVPGAEGRCKVGIRKGTGSWEGKEFNNIKAFYPKEEKQYTEGDF